MEEFDLLFWLVSWGGHLPPQFLWRWRLCLHVELVTSLEDHRSQKRNNKTCKNVVPLGILLVWWDCFFFCIVNWGHLIFNGIILCWTETFQLGTNIGSGVMDAIKVLLALFFSCFSLWNRETEVPDVLRTAMWALSLNKRAPTISFPWCQLDHCPWGRRG